MMTRTDLKPVIAFTYSLINRSRLLIAESKKLIHHSQKIIDDETARQFEQDAARRKRKGPKSPV